MTSKASAPEAPLESVPEIERLKAENASLLESLRATKINAGWAEEALEKAKAEWRAAEQRAEAAENLVAHWAARSQAIAAAEKRYTDLMGALRAACGQLDRAAADIWGRNHGSLDQFARRIDSISDGLRAAGHVDEPQVSRPKAAPEAVEKLLTDCDAALHDEERPPLSADDCPECPEEGCVLDADHEEPCDTEIPEAVADEERSAPPQERENET